MKIREWQSFDSAVISFGELCARGEIAFFGEPGETLYNYVYAFKGGGWEYAPSTVKSKYAEVEKDLTKE